MRDASVPVAVEISRVRERLEAADGLSLAMRDPHTVLDILLEAATPDDAMASLQARLDLTWLQARVVLDAQFRQATEQERLRIETEREELGRRLAYLESLPSS